MIQNDCYNDDEEAEPIAQYPRNDHLSYHKTERTSSGFLNAGSNPLLFTCSVRA